MRTEAHLHPTLRVDCSGVERESASLRRRRQSEAMDLKKEKNFFETRVIEYQNGGALAWD
jgi:hypothetical protein